MSKPIITRIDEHIEFNEAIKSFSNVGFLNDVKARILELEQQLAQHEWIPVSERLPISENLSHSNTKYLVQTRRGFKISHYIGNVFLAPDAHVIYDAASWKPITPSEVSE